MNNNINPDHYKNQCSLECIEVERLLLGDVGVCYFCLGYAIKYIWRYKNKNEFEDLEKAKWYLSYVSKLICSTNFINELEKTDVIENINILVDRIYTFQKIITNGTVLD